MKDIIGISFDTDDLDDDNAFLMMVLKEIDTNLEWKADCFTDYEDYLNSEIEGYLSIKELETFIRCAQEKTRLRSLVLLLHLKNEKYGSQRKDFSL